MLKLLSVFLIASGLTAGGFYFASLYSKKVLILREILLMISLVETQIRYACLPVSDLLRMLCENNKLKNLLFIEICREKTLSGLAFPVAWKESIEDKREFCKLLSDSKNYLIQLGADLGATDMEGQLSCCGYYKQIFEKELAESEETAKKYSKLYPALGLMTGISAAIIII